ncbi:MAG: hypothetical protein J5523_03115 [Muribaculaceae bacterium]|nr:hypothetical protein [Muribaculaceae bacterium]
MKRLKIIVFLLNLLSISATGQIPLLRNFTTQDYEGGTQNWSIDQKEDGCMLFANNNGLFIFDSDKWSSRQVPNFTNVRSVLYQEKSKRIFVGATNEFGYFYSDSNNDGYKYKSLSQGVLSKIGPFGEIWNILDLGQEIALQAKNHIFIIKQSGKIIVYPTRYRIENASVADGKLIVSAQECVYVYTGNSLKTLPGTSALKGLQVRGTLSFENGSLLFVTANHGTFLYENGRCTPYPLDVNEQLKKSQVFCAATHHNYLVFGTVRDGAIIKDLKTGINYYVNNITGLSNNTVLSLKFDESDNLWLGLDNGIAYVMIDVACRDLLGMNNSIGTGYASIIHNKQLYLGTNQGLYSIDYPLHTSITPMKPQYIHGISGQIWSLCEVGGTLLCGSDNGAFVIEGNTAHKIDKLGGTWGYVELSNHPGHVMTCDYNGFAILKKNGSGYVLQNRISGIDISGGGFLEDYDGSIWLSHWQQGVYHFWLNEDLTKAVNLEYFHRGNCLNADDNNLICKINGKVYVSSAEGFKIYDKKSRKLMSAKNIDKIFNTYGTALRVVETPTKELWAYKPNYLALATIRADGSYAVKPFAYANVVNRLQMSLGQMGILDDNHTLMNYDNGYYVMNHHFTVAEKPKQVFIRSIYSTNNNDTLLFENGGQSKVKKLAIPKNLNSLRIEYVMPEYRDNQAIQYSYYLENYDHGWSSPTHSTLKEYTHLSKGKYVFHVKAHDTLYNTTSEALIEIEILPAWYETWWAYFVYAILAFAALRYFVKYLIRRSQRELQRIKIEKERQLREQETLFQIEEEKKEKELVKLRNEQLVVDLKHKSSQLADSTMNLVRKNDMLQELDLQMQELSGIIGKDTPKSSINKMIKDVRRSIQRNIKEDENWEKFEENFNLVYDNFMKKLTEQFPDLKANDKKLCAYLRMGLSSKEMASLLNTTLRSIETARYRLRKKLNLKQGQNLTSFIQNFG